MENIPNLLPPDPTIPQLPTTTINPLDLLMLNGNPLSFFNLAQFPFISSQILRQSGVTSTGYLPQGFPSTVPLAQTMKNNPQGASFKQNEITSENSTGLEFGFSIEKPLVHLPQTLNNNLPAPTLDIPQLQIQSNPTQFPFLPSFPLLPSAFSPPWMLNKNDESSGDSGVESRSSSMDFSTISPQNYRDYKMTRNEIEDLLEQTYRENNYPKMKTKKLIQLKTGMSIEAINQRLQKKRKMDKPEGTPPRKAPTPFSMEIREKLLDKYVLGGKITLEVREELSKETGLSLKQINDFYCKKNTSMRNKLLRNPELQNEELQRLARKYRKLNGNHEDEQNNCETEGNKDKDGMKIWSISRRNTYKRSLKMPNDEINKLIEAALQVRFLPTTETKENLCKITGLTMEALTTRMSRRRRKPFPKVPSSSDDGAKCDPALHQLMGCHDPGTLHSGDSSKTPTIHDAEDIEEMEVADSPNPQFLQVAQEENSENVIIESPSPPTIKPEDIQDFLTTSYKNNLNPSFTDIEHWASRIGESGSRVYQWIKHYRSINGYTGFEEVLNLKAIPHENLDLDYNMNKNPSYRQMEFSAVLNGENGGKIFDWVKKQRSGSETM